MVKVTSLLIKAESALGFSFGVRAQTEMKIWCVKGMHLLKVVSSEKIQGLTGFSLRGVALGTRYQAMLNIAHEYSLIKTKAGYTLGT